MIPIRTETSIKATPWANYALIAANILAFFVFDWSGSEDLARIKEDRLILQADWPSLYQFFTYQFLHGGPMHLAGNMLFLWVFGNPVCAKMGGLVYALFYLAGGVFSAWGFALTSASPMLGASGAIAAVTTAYLALFPRSHVTVLFIFFIITTFEVPAMILIVFKVILWDNLLAPGLEGAGGVAYSAHLAGYLFGFVTTMLMLWMRALPRDTFDMVALLKRWNQRRAFSTAMTDPAARAQAEHGRVARTVTVSEQARAAEDAQMDQATDLRTRIAELLTASDPASAATLHEQLMTLDNRQCLPMQQQMQIARQFYESGRFPQAAAAFGRLLEIYPQCPDREDIGLLLGIIYARDLRQYRTAEKYLEASREGIGSGDRLRQCERWLETVRAALGDVAPERS
ncbi:MAG: rhomboid family intramembrane serine protease [bacterium]|nr:rhomboid family intramembrane serine protease [bacterium]